MLAQSQEASSLSYTLPDLLKLAEKNPLLVDEATAMQRLAQAKRNEVETKRWLSTFEARAFGGIVPDSTLTNKSDVNSYRSYDFENDLSFTHMGGFIRTQVDIVQPIWTWGKISHYQQATSMGFTLADLEKKKRLNDLRHLIKRAYYTLLYSTEALATVKDVEQRLTDAAEKVEKLLLKDADNVTEIDRLKIKVFLADVRNRMIDAERGRKLSRSALSEMLNLPSDWTAADERLTAETAQELDLRQVVSLALRGEPQVQQLATLIEAKEHERKAERADLFPTVFLGGQVNYAYAPGRTDVNNPYLVDEFNKFDLGAVLGMRMDLGVYRTLNKMDVMQAEIDRLKAQRAQLSLKLKVDVERMYEEAQGAGSAILINEDGLRAARSWLTSTGLAFNLGTAETKEVLESFAAYFKARADLSKSIFTLNMALSDLSEAAGSEMVSRLGN